MRTIFFTFLILLFSNRTDAFFQEIIDSFLTNQYQESQKKLEKYHLNYRLSLENNKEEIRKLIPKKLSDSKFQNSDPIEILAILNIVDIDCGMSIHKNEYPYKNKLDFFIDLYKISEKNNLYCIPIDEDMQLKDELKIRILSILRYNKQYLMPEEIELIERLSPPIFKGKNVNENFKFVKIMCELGSKKFNDAYIINQLEEKYFKSKTGLSDDFDMGYAYINFLGKIKSKNAINILHKIRIQRDTELIKYWGPAVKLYDAFINDCLISLSQIGDTSILPDVYNLLRKYPDQGSWNLLECFEYIKDDSSVFEIINFINILIDNINNGKIVRFDAYSIKEGVEILGVLKDKRALEFLNDIQNKKIKINFIEMNGVGSLESAIKKAIRDINL